MTKDTFRWVAQPPGDGLTNKLNEEIRSAEEDGYELVNKEMIERPEEGNDGRAVILLRFSKNKYANSDEDSFVKPVGLSIGNTDEETSQEFSTEALREEIAEKTSEALNDNPDHQIVDMEVDEKGRTLFLLFEPQ